tara:strand:- start:203 stop:451 length:249 start_codon:yes stop_codon:yes gene_type:complete
MSQFSGTYRGSNLMSYYEELLRPIVGAKIIGLADDSSELNEQYVGLVVRKNDKTFVIWAERDPEGNGPGAFGLQEVDEGEGE